MLSGNSAISHSSLAGARKVSKSARLERLVLTARLDERGELRQCHPPAGLVVGG